MAFSCEKCCVMSVCKTISMQRLRNSRKSAFCMLAKMLQSWCSRVLREKRRGEENKSDTVTEWCAETGIGLGKGGMRPEIESARGGVCTVKRG